MEKTKQTLNVQPGSTRADGKYRVEIQDDGPYLVYGRPPMSQQFIVTNAEGENWDFAEGESYDMSKEPACLCRCGESGRKPYCDGSHTHADWDPRLTASREPLLKGAEVFDGPAVALTDNEKYCVFARFCDAKGRVWNLVGASGDPEARELTIREANLCPGGRLSAWDKSTETPFEPRYEPALGLIEDLPLAISAGLWVTGGIPVQTQEGETYEIRNRVVLCRCGQSSNKPFCDGTHASMKFRDGLAAGPEK